MKKVNTLIIVVLSVLMFSMQIDAQERNGGRGSFDREDFISKRNVYITEAVALTAEEAAVFIPMDNELMRKKFEIGRECHRIDRELRNKSDKTDEECKKLLKCREEVKEKRDQLDREYLEKFKNVLSAEKILKYQSADRDFYESFFRNR